MATVNYMLNLTGSKFFDTVLFMKAKELAANYPGLSVSVQENRLNLQGEIDAQGAAKLENEIGFYGFES